MLTVQEMIESKKTIEQKNVDEFGYLPLYEYI